MSALLVATLSHAVTFGALMVTLRSLRAARIRNGRLSRALGPRCVAVATCPRCSALVAEAEAPDA